MKIVLINPPRLIEGGNIWSSINSVMPPIGLATLCAVLRDGGAEASVIDAAALGLGSDEILSRIDPNTDLIGLSATTPEIDAVTQLAAMVREQRSGARIVLGGVHPTVLHESLVKDGRCDMVVRGEGEEAILALARNDDPETIPGLTWRAAGGNVVVNPPRREYVDLERLPFPSYDSLPMKQYRSALGAAKRSPSIGIITSRGCPGTCTFCYSGMFGTRIRFLSAERVLEHIELLRTRYGIREISFYDDTFTASRSRVERLCSLLIGERTGISWSCFARADTIDPDLLSLMKKAGCHQIGFGFESADEAVLKNINKRITTTKIDQAVAWMKEAGIDIRGAFMLGNVGETEESIRRTIEYSRKLGIQYAMYNITTPFPGTQLYAWADQQGYIRHKDWKLYDLAHTVLELPTVSSAAVQRAYHQAYRDFYLDPSYMLDRILSIRSPYDVRMYLRAFGGILRTVVRNRFHAK